MQIKVIKKDSYSTQNNESVNLNSETESPKVANVEKKCGTEHLKMGLWITAEKRTWIFEQPEFFAGVEAGSLIAPK